MSRHFKSRDAYNVFLATESQPAGWNAVTHALNCESVFTNPSRTCHHADLVQVAIPGDRALLRLKVYMLRGTAKDVWNLVSDRERAGQV